MSDGIGSPDSPAVLHFGARNPKRLTRADVDSAVLHAHGLTLLAEKLWRDGAVVSQHARRSVTKHLRERFGARDPHSGAILRVVFVLLLISALPVGILNGIRLGIENTAPAAAALSVIAGAGSLLAVMCAGRRPLGRPGALQTALLAGLLTTAGVTGWVATRGWMRVAFAVGAALAVVAAIIVRAVRARSGALTAEIDDAVELAHCDVAGEVAAHRERLSRELADALAARSDLGSMQQQRAAAISDLRARGGSLGHEDEEALPGAYIIAEQTALWLPLSQRGLRPPAPR